MTVNYRWRNQLSVLHTDAALRDWLREPASLTARLQRHGRFRLQVLRQRLHHANADECAILGLQRDTRCHVREVVLYCNDVPVIFAHTILPASPSGVLTRWFARLGSRSLGSLLFTHPGFVRGKLGFAHINACHPLYGQAASLAGKEASARLFGRRCLHRYRQQSVLVTEVFLPAITRL